ncbi:ComEC/Rec2 family competence protein [uncultured Mediterranea sp.]|uniref:ComEC/Rec2 family competence protein n=1 Tax=uncultured Mediterranea sp. TaxID=1926662 RepID=UPI0027D948A0|nr:ComEC/Rec2 family competence protein [uncultured Mediterranea sp.]
MFLYGLQRYPFLRLLLPLVVGIVCGNALPHTIPADGLKALVLTAIVLLIAAHRLNRHRLFGAALYTLLAASGCLLMQHSLARADFPFTGRDGFYKVIIHSQPETKAHSLLCPSLILAAGKNDTTLTSVSRGKQFLLYLQPDSAARSLQRGDILWIHTRLAPPANQGIPDEFDYARYLRLRGVCGTAYVPSGYWQKAGHNSTLTLRQLAADRQARIVEQYRRQGFTGDELAVLSALTVGHKDELSEDIIETYSVTGASHVLALSGLHIGFLYALFWFLASPLWKRWRLLKLPLLLLLVALLWGFAFLTGLSPSVVRSVTMFSILALSCLQTEKPLTANTVSATAFLMLLIRPDWLFDVGFQLSFCAVATILLFYPRLNRLYRGENRLLHKVWSLMSVSIAAQLGTAPLVMHYFARFSTHFLLTNLWVIPLVSIILYAAVAWLALSPLAALQAMLSPLLKKLIHLQNDVLRQIEQWPFASIDHIWLDWTETFLIYALLLAACRYLWQRTAQHAYTLVFILLAGVGYHAVNIATACPSKSIVFYNVKDTPAVHCLTGGKRSWLACADSLPQTGWLQRSLAPHWDHLRLTAPQVVTGRYQAEDFSLHDNIVTYAGRRVCLLNDNRWRNLRSDHPLSVDYLYVARGYQGGIRELTSLFRIGTVIIDGSLSAYYRKLIVSDCHALNLPCRSLEEEGCIRIPL